MSKNETLAGTKVSVDMFLGRGEDKEQGASSRMAGIPVFGELSSDLGRTPCSERRLTCHVQSSPYYCFDGGKKMVLSCSQAKMSKSLL